MSKISLTDMIDAQVNEYLEEYSKLMPRARTRLANSLTAYNTLLSLRAHTFEQMALLNIAKEQNWTVKGPHIDFSKIIPPCIDCGDNKRVLKDKTKENLYTCKACNKRFTVNHDSISSRTKCSSLTWMKVLHCLMNHLTVEKTCEYCEINQRTYYNIRNRLFYAMQILLEDIKLYGVIECDNTFVRVNYKSERLNDEMYPEDSPFDRINFIPRKSKKRGGTYSEDRRNLNSICIFTAIDNYGHVVVRYVGIGNATATKLLRAVPESKYLSKAPDVDPFDLNRRAGNTFTSDSSITLLVSDKEKAIEKYSTMLDIKYESHVYKRNNKYMRIPENIHHIQHANAMHKRLKEFLRKSHHVSSKYLPGFLVLFEFLENTGGSNEAIERLFEILVRPGYSITTHDLKQSYKTPNYLVEWKEDNTALKKLTYNQLLAIYLYHQLKLDKGKSKELRCTVEDILEQTGYNSYATVRRLYKNAASAGLVEIIYNKMASESNVKVFKAKEKPKKKPSPPQQPKSAAARDILHIYDAYYNMIKGPAEEICSLNTFLERLYKDSEEKIAPSTVKYGFSVLVKTGQRKETFSELSAEGREKKRNFRKETDLVLGEKCYKIRDRICLSYKNKGEPIPKTHELIKIIAEEAGLTKNRVLICLDSYTDFRRSLPDNFESQEN